MPHIHKTASKYTAPTPLQGWQWLPFTDKIMLNVITRAVSLIDKRIKGTKPCEASFKALPGGKSFSDIWNQANVWVSLLAMGEWMAAATLIHELAHVNGAPGNDTQAEDTLLKCMLKDHHNPNIIGQIRNSKIKTTALA